MSFPTIVGHQRLLVLLAGAVARDTVPPALLFAGPSGVGKRRTAVALAQAFNCLNPTDDVPFERAGCGTCSPCVRIAAGQHPDVAILEPGSIGSIKIEQVREVVERAQYRPFEGRKRVVIIDDAEALGAGAQNALLKTLEEPPSTAVFVLVSSIPDALLATVRSRCCRLRFGALQPEQVAEILVRDHAFDEDEAGLAAADAEGSVGRALDVHASDLGAGRVAAQQLLEQVATASDPARRLSAAKALSSGKSKAATERQQLATCLRALASMLRDLGSLAVQADEVGLANPDLTRELRQLSRAFDPSRTARAYQAVDRALGALERNASPKLVSAWLALQI